ncbi:MAG: hypothetical protein SGBAC_006945, partial [Bacillariaceae sp.]
MVKRKRSFGYHPEGKEHQYLKDANHNEGEIKDPVFLTFLSIVNLSKQKSTDESKSKMNKVVKKLLSYLPATASGDDDTMEPDQLKASILSANDVVTLLLPWSIKTLLRSLFSTSADHKNDDNETQWHTLKTCLEFVVQQQQTEHNKGSTEGAIKVSDILTLGALHKLVPLAIKIALLQNNNRSQATAATCYCILVDQYYTPPFDSICDSLLSMLDRDRDVMENDLDEGRFQAMVVATLRLLHRRLGKGNPKK